MRGPDFQHTGRIVFNIYCEQLGWQLFHKCYSFYFCPHGNAGTFSLLWQTCRKTEGSGGKVKKSSLDPLPAEVLKAKAVRGILRREIFMEEKTQISGFYLFLHWSFPDLTISKPQSKPDIAKHFHSILSWFVLQNRKLPFAQLKTHKKVKMWLSTKPPLPDIAI